MGDSPRKRVAQIGVVLFIISMVSGIFEPFIPFSSNLYSMLLYSVLELGIVVLAVAAILPQSDQDEWGSMWPLVGYDNAIDGIYTRGPWRTRFEELEEQEIQGRVTSGMIGLFDER